MHQAKQVSIRVWRPPTEGDRARKCRARSSFEKRPFYVEWNAEYKCWAFHGRPHILVAVHEILSTQLPGG